MNSAVFWLVWAAAPGCHTREGGMDGAGSMPAGRLSGDVMLQALWREQELNYVVFNEGHEDIEILVTYLECSMLGCGEEQELPGAWHVPADSVRTFTGDDVAVLADPTKIVWFTLGDGTWLSSPQTSIRPEWGSASSIINTEGFWGEKYYGVQLETDFVTAPGASFTVTVSFAVAGRLTLQSRSEPLGSVAFVDIVAVRSDVGVVHATTDGFSVDVPGEQLAEGLVGRYEPHVFFHADAASPPAPVAVPVTVEVDVTIPATFVGGSFIAFQASTCHARGAYGCTAPQRLTRGIPLRE